MQHSTIPVVALGEIGLDYTTVVLALHLRGMSTHQAGREVYLRGLALASKILWKRQMFQLHCFSGPTDVVKDCLPVFPNTHFGFSNMVGNFSSSQCQGLKAVPKDHLLLVIDAPYFNPKKYKVNVPCLLSYTAETVA